LCRAALVLVANEVPPGKSANVAAGTQAGAPTLQDSAVAGRGVPSSPAHSVEDSLSTAFARGALLDQR
jgi:hypothetical protein